MNIPYVKYAEDVLNHDIVSCRQVESACQRFADDIGGNENYWFDHEEAQRYIDFFQKFLKHSKGVFAGKSFELLPWQQFVVANLFGWKSIETGNRRYRTAYIQVGRKNGKSTMLSGIALAMLDFDQEQGSEVYFAATKRDQARICFDEAARMVKSSPMTL